MKADSATPTNSVPGSVGPTDVRIQLPELAALYALESVRGFGPQKFKELHEASLKPSDVLADPGRLPTTGKRGDQFRRSLDAIDEASRLMAQTRAARQIQSAEKAGAVILTYGHS